MDREEAMQQFRKIVEEKLEGVDPVTVTDSTKIAALGDELDVKEILMTVEDFLSIELTDTEFKDLKTVGQVIDLMVKTKTD
ncbi:acyl carrier protein [Pseudomonas sp. F3-2]|uniref:acyl carrier protein n=1 Tax=Pseudomonas sp. F3-2 TaxID=3141539 RepID=UPI00315CA502